MIKSKGTYADMKCRDGVENSEAGELSSCASELTPQANTEHTCIDGSFYNSLDLPTFLL